VTVRIFFFSSPPSTFLCFLSRGGEGSPHKAGEALPRPQKLNIFQHLNEEEINKTYEEWMKIAADNASFLSSFTSCWFVGLNPLCVVTRKSTPTTPGPWI
jgi:hypothetical protein